MTFRLHPANAKTVEWDWKLLAYVMEEEVTTVCMQKSFAEEVLTRNKSDSKSGSTVFAI